MSTSIYDWDYEAEPKSSSSNEEFYATVGKEWQEELYKLAVLRFWKEDKSILEITNLTNIPREKVIDIISDYVKMEFSINL